MYGMVGSLVLSWFSAWQSRFISFSIQLVLDPATLDRFLPLESIV